MPQHLKYAAKELVSTCLGVLRSVATEVRDAAMLVFRCQHKKISYLPRWHGEYIYRVCAKCGRKQLYDPNTGFGYGEFSHDLNELIASAKRSGSGTKQQSRNTAGNEHRRSLGPVRTEAPAPPPRVDIPISLDLMAQPEFADTEEVVGDHRRQKFHTRGSALGPRLSCMGTELVAPVRKLLRRRAEECALRLQVVLTHKREKIRCEEELGYEWVRLRRERRREEAEYAERRRDGQIPAEQQAEQECAQVAAIREVAAGHTARQPRPEPSSRGASRFTMWGQGVPIATSPTAIITAFGATLVVLLGFLTYANRRPPSPPSPGAMMNNGSIKQGMPSGAASIMPTPAVVPKPSAVAPVENSSAIHPAAQKSRARQRSATRIRRKPQNDWLAEDEVVIRHFQILRPQQPQPSNAKLKRHSDMQ